MNAPLVRIGELGRRVGIPPGTLRAWERRYGVLEPVRTESGYRLYTAEDERRLQEMVELITQGSAPAEAAARVLANGGGKPAAGGNGATDPTLPEQLVFALERFRDGSANNVFDAAVAAYTVESLIDGVVLPTLRLVGERWEDGSLTIGQEHYISNFIRGRLLALARGWGGGNGPVAVLACPSEEEHDLGVISLGLLLRDRGWSITYLGVNTPLETIAETAAEIAPRAVVVAVTSPEAAEALLASEAPTVSGEFYVAGSAATPDLASHLDAGLLNEGVPAGARRIASGE